MKLQKQYHFIVTIFIALMVAVSIFGTAVFAFTNYGTNTGNLNANVNNASHLSLVTGHELYIDDSAFLQTFSYLDDFENVKLIIDDNNADKEYSRKIKKTVIKNNAGEYKTEFTTDGIKVTSRYVKLESDEGKKIKQAYDIFNTSKQDISVDVSIEYEIISSAVRWDKKDYTLTEKKQIFQPYPFEFPKEVQAQIPSTYFEGAEISFGNSSLNFHDIAVSEFDYEATASIKNGKNVIEILIHLDIPANTTITIDPILQGDGEGGGAGLLCLDPPDGIIDWWPGEEHALDIWDGNDGIILGEVSYEEGYVGQAFLLDGVDDAVDVGENVIGVMDEITMEVWVKKGASQDFQAIAGVQTFSARDSITNDIGFYLNPGDIDQLFWQVSTNPSGRHVVELSGDNALQEGIWTHLVGTFDGRTLRFYVDGEEKNTIRIEGDEFEQAQADRKFHIGKGTGRPYFFDGLIDEVSVYERALTAQEVLDLYTADTAGKCGKSCGDGIQVQTESCDDGNTRDGDGCSAQCLLEEDPPRGDSNDDGIVDTSDAVFILLHLFSDTVEPSCLNALDVNGDGTVDLSDAIYLLAYLFQGGAAPVDREVICEPQLPTFDGVSYIGPKGRTEDSPTTFEWIHNGFTQVYQLVVSRQDSEKNIIEQLYASGEICDSERVCRVAPDVSLGLGRYLWFVSELLPQEGGGAGPGILVEEAQTYFEIATPSILIPMCTEGSLPGSFSVNDDGSGRYFIPIQVPPGSAGMYPDISLEYNSQVGNGQLGVRWFLGGVDGITRCGANIAQDGFAGGIDYSPEDKFCYQGQRLIAVEDAQGNPLPTQQDRFVAYGADGTVYKTEIDSFSKFVSHGSAGNGPERFTVWTKDGRIKFFGGDGVSEEGRIEAQGVGTVRAWMLTKITDRTNKYMEFDYTEDNSNGEFWLEEIRYTGNLPYCPFGPSNCTCPGTPGCANRPPRNKVVFEYEARPDIYPVFEGGSVMRSTKRLKIIKTFINPQQLVFQYNLEYNSGPTTKRSRLQSVELCDPQGRCYPKTLFQWHNEDFTLDLGPGFLPTVTTNSGFLRTSYETIANSYTDRDTHFPADFNGDGKADLISVLDKGDDLRINVARSNGTTLTRNATHIIIPEILGVDEPNFLQRTINTVFGPIFPRQVHWQDNRITLTDVNADGMTDLVIPYEADLGQAGTIARVRTYVSDGSDFTLSGTSQNGFDIDPGSQFFTMDISGDGVSELIELKRFGVLQGQQVEIANTNRTWTKFFDGTTFPPGFVTQNILDPDDESLPLPMDVNGDGRSDFVSIRHKQNGDVTADVYLSSGANFNPRSSSVVLGTWDSQNIHLSLNVNGDSNGDIILISKDGNNTKAEVFYSNGLHFIPAFIEQFGVWHNDNRFIIIDVNGDGRDDIVKISNGNNSNSLATIYLSTGVGFEPVVTNTVIPEISQSLEDAFGAFTWDITDKFLSMDMSGDGKDDIVRLSTNNGKTDARTYISGGKIPDRIENIENGYGHQTDIVHVPITNSSVYLGNVNPQNFITDHFIRAHENGSWQYSPLPHSELDVVFGVYSESLISGEDGVFGLSGGKLFYSHLDGASFVFDLFPTQPFGNDIQQIQLGGSIAQNSGVYGVDMQGNIIRAVFANGTWDLTQTRVNSFGDTADHRSLISGNNRVYGVNTDGKIFDTFVNGNTAQYGVLQNHPASLEVVPWSLALGGTPSNNIGVFGVSADTDQITRAYFANGIWNWDLPFGSAVNNDSLISGDSRVYGVDANNRLFYVQLDAGFLDFDIIPNQDPDWDIAYYTLALGGTPDSHIGVFSVSWDGDLGRTYFENGIWNFEVINDFDADVAPGSLISGDNRVYGVTWEGKIFQAYHNGTNVVFEILANQNPGLNMEQFYLALAGSPTNNIGIIGVNRGNVTPIHDTRSRQDSRYVVSSVRTADGIGGQYQKDYKYVGAKYDNTRRLNLGFSEMHMIDPQTGIKEELLFEQDFPVFGNVKEVKRTLGADTFYQKTSDWTSDNLGAHYFVKLDNSHLVRYEPGFSLPIEDVVTDYEYDNFGGVIEIASEWTDGYKEIDEHEYLNDEDGWLLGLPEETTITRRSHFLNFDQSRNIERTFSTETGLLSTTTQYWTEIIAQADVRFEVSEEFSYDDFGNVTQSRIFGSNIDDRVTDTFYDIDGVFPEWVINPAGHQEFVSYDRRFGHVASRSFVNDPLGSGNMQNMTWTYDTFGRTKQSTEVDGSIDYYSYCPQTDTKPLFGDHALTIIANKEPAFTMHYDSLDRRVRMVSEGFDGKKIFTDIEYDSFGLVGTTSLPYFETDQPKYFIKKYDVYDRKVYESDPFGGEAEISYNGPAFIVANPLYASYPSASSITVSMHPTRQDYLNQQTRFIQDPRGSTIQIVDGLDNPTTVEYDGFYNELRKSDPDENIVSISYDSNYRVRVMDDPDRGHWEYNHNVLNELTYQRDANGWVTNLEYDTLGRVTTSTDPDVTRVWKYDEAEFGQNAVSEMHSTDSGGNQFHKETYGYDALGRIESATTTINGSDYFVRNTYDAKSRLQTVSYPGSVNFVAKYAYDNLGHVLEVQNHSGGPSAVSSFWRASEKNAQAQLKKEKFGNGITTSVDYHPLFGVSSINVKKGIHSLLELLYTYDENGNLQKHLDRTIETAILQEEFTYDKLNRLEKMDNYVIDATDLVNPKVFQYAKEYGYTDSGNILGISDVGNFGYGSGNGFGLGDAGPHAITSNGVGDTYTYDDNGNTIASGNVASGNVTDIEWYAFNKAKSTVNQAQGTEVQFQYNSYNDKIHQVFHDQNSHSTTTYIGEWYEKVEHENGLVEHKHYVSAGGAPIAIFVKESTGNEDVLYLHRSNLTSVAMITDKSGNILEQLSYHPFGLRRPPDWSQSGSVSSITDHGYTDHEHIANDAVGIIDTGGRLYNPQTGRFLSNDSYFEFPAYSQATNPYSYTVNNPVSYYDPSGNQTKPPPPWYERMWKSFVKWEHDFNHPTAKPKPWERNFNLGAENFVRQYHPVIVILENGIIVVSGENLNGNAADRVKASIKLLKEVSRYRNVKSAMDAANVVIKQAEKKLTKEAVEQLKKDLKKAVEELERMERERFIDSEPDTIKEPSDREITSAPKFSTPGSTAPATEFPTLGSTAEGIAFLAKAIGFSALSSLFPSSGATATASTPATTVPAESLNPVKILACVFTGGCGG